MENSPDDRHLKTTTFVLHATRGVIRDQNTRRKAMLLLLALALLLLILGFTVLQPALNPQEHPWRVIIFWIVCIWLTFTALLLALFDLLVLRLQSRRAERELREKLEPAGNSSAADPFNRSRLDQSDDRTRARAQRRSRRGDCAGARSRTYAIWSFGRRDSGRVHA